MSDWERCLAIEAAAFAEAEAWDENEYSYLIHTEKEDNTMKGKRITIQLQDGTKVAARVLYGSGDNYTVQTLTGAVHEIDRNIRNDTGAYVVLA